MLRALATRRIRSSAPIAETIATQASGFQSDFIYMGTHSRGAISGAFLGSVVMGVLHRRPCPVVVVP